MPINIPKDLPAGELLRQEKIFVMDEDRARTQDIRPLNILILNLMPEKEKTELQLLRLLGNTPLQVNITFLRTSTYQSKNVSSYHLEHFYTVFDEVKSRRFDGMIITGAPVEKMDFEAVDYWDELKQIMDWTKTNVTSTLHICWGAQAALYYHYGIEKYELPEKCFGIFKHRLFLPMVKLVRGFDEVFNAPHSRYTDVARGAIENHPELQLVSISEEGSPFIVMDENGKNIMITGHLEYDATTLADEYVRDQQRGLGTALPKNYFPNNDANERPLHTWRSHSYLLFSNWLNYYVYQETPYQW
ncbi:MAG: homoserine O-succinyltransferase [Heyndrickxia faecalis]|uniref:homoserine O-acetyltransferase MetA n=1 Tax=Heyndrickxia TaxID=2837504 RepID=UPI00055696E8|nr:MULTISPECIES: homoserine O-succinyltransferase [Heyndrickxia]APB35417.1 homoserine O-succinyltransferase [Heyndrickxia coagulans]KGT39092.1 homoserine O-succinyltransferase [Heyndrickxia coagulans P38]MBQ4912765.1 homoserine O-succinyltransferase [Heyndrickxia faecalis]MCI1574574.1 homoserine O-succinyltransferase [Heyndrickxia coagulans]MEC2222037.1 homoserine O-succinyltransferase [Weizmannia sp. CD-2023]